MPSISLKTLQTKMNEEVITDGFSSKSIKDCFESDEDAGKLLQEARKHEDLYRLLRVPEILDLIIIGVLYSEKKSLPERKTELYKNLFEFLMDRSTLKPHNFGCKSSEVPNINSMLFILGKFAWKALQNDIRQLIIDKVTLILQQL